MGNHFAKEVHIMKNKHLTLKERETIEAGLKEGRTFKDIAFDVGKDPTTISKEVLRHVIVSPTSVTRVDGQGRPIPAAPCPKLLRPPYVCHSCPHVRRKCAHDKRYYRARSAQQAYETLRSESREGIPLNKERFYEIDRILSDRIKRGQRLYHVLRSENLGVSKSTVYRHLHKGYLSISAMDMPRVVKFKPRKTKKADTVPKALKEGRSYADFRAHVEENQISSWVEMDTVIGTIGGKTILTFDFTFCNFMFGLLLDDKTASSASSAILGLKTLLADHGWDSGSVFPVILTDNGGEFADVFAFENDLDGSRKTRLFFCDPMRSSQKPHVEKNHTLFRDIVPKGRSFDAFSQDTVNLIFSHVNSVRRKSLNGKTPHELFSFAFGQALPGLLGVRSIPPERVVQSPLLQKSEEFVRTLQRGTPD